MDENKLRFGVGVMVISAVGIAIILTFLFGAFPSVLSEHYTLHVQFPSAAGININTNVVRDGVRIGRVSDIQLLRDGGVMVSLQMQDQYRKDLTHSYIPQIGSGNLVSGDAQVEFIKGNPEDLRIAYGDDDEILTQPYDAIEETIYVGKVTPGFFDMQKDLINTFQALQLAGQSIELAGSSVNDLAVEIKEVVGGSDNKIDAISAEAVATLEEFQGAIRDIRAIVGDPETQANLQASIKELPELLTRARQALESTQKALESFERVGVAAEQTVKSVQGTAENIERFTSPFADQSEAYAAQLLKTLDSLDGALVQVQQFGQTINASDGTLRRFIEDDEIYWEIRRTIQNIEEATARVRPIMDDVRIFTDKIARDPRELGVRGAINRRPSGTGLK